MTGFVLVFFNLENDSGITYNYKYLETKSESVSRWVLSLFGILWTAACLLCPWDSPGKNTGVGWHFLLQGLFLTQGWSPGLLHCRQIVYGLSHQRSLIYAFKDYDYIYYMYLKGLHKD